MTEKKMKTISVWFGLGLLALVGCNSDSDNDDEIVVPPPEPVAMAKVQIIHASPDAPKVNLILDGAEIAASVDYKVATGVTDITAGEHTAEVKAILPDSSTIDAFDAVTADFAEDTIYTVLAVGGLSAIEPLVLTRQDLPIAADRFRVQIVHAAPQAPMVDVYVTAPDANLSESSPLVTASFKESLDATSVEAGDYQIRITVAGDSSAVVFDSGTVTLAAGADLLIAAIENVGPGEQPVNLLIADDSGATELLDSVTPTSVRVVHASADAPAVDVVANDGFEQPLIADLAFGEFAGYVDLSSAAYNIKVVPTGEMAPAVIEADLELVAGIQYNVIALNTLELIEPLVVTADNRSVATEAKLRIIHGSPTAQNVDIYLVEPGASIDGATPALTDVAFKADTDFLSIAEGSYDVVVTPTGSTDAAIGPATITLTAGGIFTAIAVDGEGGGTPLGLILLDDFVTL
jgi:hypothetical protein